MTLKYFPGTVGKPIAIDMIALGLAQSDIVNITSVVFTAQRPPATWTWPVLPADGGTFTATFSQNDVNSGTLTYTLQPGDLTVGGFYHFKIVVNITGGVVVTLYGDFYIHNPPQSVTPTV